jgi:hypothetical protein
LFPQIANPKIATFVEDPQTFKKIGSANLRNCGTYLRTFVSHIFYIFFRNLKIIASSRVRQKLLNERNTIGAGPAAFFNLTYLRNLKTTTTVAAANWKMNLSVSWN